MSLAMLPTLCMVTLLFSLTPSVMVTKNALMADESIRHTPTAEDTVRYDAHHFGIILRCNGNELKKVQILVLDDKDRIRAFQMEKVESFDGKDKWRLKVDAGKELHYAFALNGDYKKGASFHALDSSGVHDTDSPTWFKQNPADYAEKKLPTWPSESVFYQIFPDRFANGDLTNDGSGSVSFGDKPDNRRQGGDLLGITNHLEYLKSLGINAIYLNPIVEAMTSHGYDTIDYRKVDPHFGDEADFRNLVDKLHQQDTKIILDGVFNHSGSDFFAFKDLETNGEKSPYKDWYTVHSYPASATSGAPTYETFEGQATMPKLNVSNPDTEKYLVDSILHWENLDIDGWRLDAADRVPHSFWQAARAGLASDKKSSWLLGEIWTDAHAWIANDQLDSVTDDRWRQNVLEFIRTQDFKPSALDSKLRFIREDYPPNVSNQLFHFISNHDVPRAKTALSNSEDKLKQAFVMLLTYPGVPCIYYGDEVGMSGGADPANREAMIWDVNRQDKPLLDFVKQLVDLRKNRQSLCTGDFNVLMADDDLHVFGYERTERLERTVILLNNGEEAATVRIPSAQFGASGLVGLAGSSASTGTGSVYNLTIPAHGYLILGTQ